MSYLLWHFHQIYIFAVPELDVSEVATNAKTFVALAVAPELTFNMSEVVKSDIVSVPASILKVSAPAPPDSSSFSAPPVRLSFRHHHIEDQSLHQR